MKYTFYLKPIIFLPLLLLFSCRQNDTNNLKPATKELPNYINTEFIGDTNYYGQRSILRLNIKEDLLKDKRTKIVLYFKHFDSILVNHGDNYTFHSEVNNNISNKSKQDTLNLIIKIYNNELLLLDEYSIEKVIHQSFKVKNNYSKGRIENDMREGKWYFYNFDMQICQISEWHNGLKDGIDSLILTNGDIESIRSYKMNIKHGIFEDYLHSNNNVYKAREYHYQNDTLKGNLYNYLPNGDIKDTVNVDNLIDLP